MRKVLIKSDGWLRQKTSGTQKMHSHFKCKSSRYELKKFKLLLTLRPILMEFKIAEKLSCLIECRTEINKNISS